MVLRARPGRNKEERAVVRRLSRARKAPAGRSGAGPDDRAGLVGATSTSDYRGAGLQPEERSVEAAPLQRLGPARLDDLGGQGRKRRITQDDRSTIISLVKTVPPGRLKWEPVGSLWAFGESGPSLATRQAQPPCHRLGLGQTNTANPPTTTPICVHRLRNPALAENQGVPSV